MSPEVDWSRIVDSWGTRQGVEGQREHTARAVEQDPVPPETPVAGCECVRCETYRAGGDTEDADVAAWLLDRLARQTRPADRQPRAASAVQAWSEIGCTLPSPAVLAKLAERRPGALPPRGEDEDRDPLPVEDARRIPIRQVAARLGLGEPVGRWGEPRVLCPLHDDTNPSLRLREDEGLWYCDVCAVGGDGIELARRALGMDFADAVRWLVEGRSARVRDPAQASLAERRPA